MHVNVTDRNPLCRVYPGVLLAGAANPVSSERLKLSHADELPSLFSSRPFVPAARRLPQTDELRPSDSSKSLDIDDIDLDSPATRYEFFSTFSALVLRQA